MIVFSLLFEQLQLSDRFVQQKTAHSRIYKAGLELNMERVYIKDRALNAKTFLLVQVNSVLSSLIWCGDILTRQFPSDGYQAGFKEVQNERL
jgi:hypothetical protein